MEAGKPLRQSLQEQGYDIPPGQAIRQLIEQYGGAEIQRLREVIQTSPQLAEYQIQVVCKRLLDRTDLTEEALDRIALVLQECASDILAHKDNIA
jgi:hypothetical protein